MNLKAKDDAAQETSHLSKQSIRPLPVIADEGNKRSDDDSVLSMSVSLVSDVKPKAIITPATKRSAAQVSLNEIKLED